MLAIIKEVKQIITHGKPNAIGVITHVKSCGQVGTVTLPCSKNGTVTATVYYSEFKGRGKLEKGLPVQGKFIKTRKGLPRLKKFKIWTPPEKEEVATA